MTTFRRHPRLWVTAWLVFQVASLSALVPRNCCAAHQPAAVKTEHSSHDSVPATDCPMLAADGTACPMHRGHGGHGDHREHGESSSHEDPSGECSIRGRCAGPMASLLALLSNQGVLPEGVAALPDVESRSVSPAVRESVVSRLASPDPPPPRA